MKYYIIAGEASGDLHAANLLNEIRLLDSDAVIRGWGGDLMAAAGADIVKHYRDLAFMGFFEVAANLRTILRNIAFCKKDIALYKPDVIILVDYPGFNLRIAEFAHDAGFKVIYYISPQLWAWKQSRVQIIKRCVDKMLVILPFEKDFYRKHGYNVDFTGHPLLDAIEDEKMKNDFDVSYKTGGEKIIALLPGSRKQEISVMLPIMLDAVKGIAGYKFMIAAAPSVPGSFYTGIVKDASAEIIYNDTYGLLRHSTAALVTSGTATLEAALFNVPEVVCYKGNSISYLIAKKLVKVNYISLVNLIMNREVVKELVQNELTPENLHRELIKLLENETQQALTKEYAALKELLGGKGASKRAAKIIYAQVTQ